MSGAGTRISVYACVYVLPPLPHYRNSVQYTSVPVIWHLDVCMYVYIHAYIHTYIHIYNIYIYIYIYTHTHIVGVLHTVAWTYM